MTLTVTDILVQILSFCSNLVTKSTSTKLLSSDNLSLPIQGSETEGVFLLTTENAFLPVKRVHSVNTYSRISTLANVAFMSLNSRGVSSQRQSRI